MKGVGVASTVAIDWTKCFGYEKLIDEEIGHYSTIEVTEDLKEGGLAANPAWERWYQFLAETWQTDFRREIIDTARRIQAPRLLSLGCGYGGMELDCARSLQGEYSLVALDVNPNLFAGAREVVAREGLRVEFEAMDLNFVELEENAFDVVFAHASLHHLLNYEHLFAQVHRSLRDGGRLIVLDIIGKMQVLFWPENIRFATELVSRMPERYRRRLEAEPASLFAHYAEGADQQGMEGIRQEDLEEQIARCFRPLKTFKYNSFVRLICTHPALVPLFDPRRPEDVEYLDALFRLDLEQIETGGLRATEMFAVYEKLPRVEAAELTPRAADGPKVSVCVACEGSAEMLRTCLSSILAQNHGNLELLLTLPAEGGEAVAEQVLDLVSDRADLRLIPPSPGGVANGYQAAVAAARGEYVALISGRDAWYPVKLSEQVAFLEARPDLGFTYAQATVVDERGRRTSRAFGTDIVGEDLSPQDFERVADGCDPLRSSLLFRRARWEEIAPPKETQVAEREVARRLSVHWPGGFQARPLSMLRAPAPGSEKTAGGEPSYHGPPVEDAPHDEDGSRAEPEGPGVGLLARLARWLSRRPS